MDYTNLVHASATRQTTKSKCSCCEAPTWAKELHMVLCMQGGDDDLSYAKNSEAPASAINLSKPFLMESIKSMKLFATDQSSPVRIADLGCATGHNTLSTMDLVVESLRQRFEREGGRAPEFEAYFCDLPLNDFNTLFRSLMSSSSCSASTERLYYAAGVPGSFYDRLFPRQKLHVVVSLSALHWLSKIPEKVLDKESSAWNKGRAWIDGARKEVVDAYAKQSEEDLRAFLRCRKEEMVEGGVLFVLMAGRAGSQQSDNQLGDPDSRAKHPFTSFMDQAWQDLLDEGLIDEETRDTFNIPAYMRSTKEVAAAFEQCGGFEIRQLEFHKMVEHPVEKQEELAGNPGTYARAKANLVRATMTSIVEAHVGGALSEEFFKRFERRVCEDVDTLRKTCFYGLIVVCATRK